MLHTELRPVSRYAALGRARAALAGVLIAFAAWTLPPMLLGIGRRPSANDFRLYYTAARLGLGYGWSRLYDLPLQARLLADLGFQPYLNPPLMAWLAVPLTWLPFEVAESLWAALLLAAVVASWLLLRPAAEAPRWWWLLAFLALFPAMFSIGIGQPQAFVLLAFAMAVWLQRHDRPFWAGAVLSVVWLKPQLAFLLPVGLLAARQWRMLVGLAVAGLLLGVVQLAALGPHGIQQYWSALQLASTFELQRRLSLAGVAPGWLFSGLRVAVLGLLVLACMGRDRRPEPALVAVPVASLLVTPYSGFQDLALLAGVAWIWLGYLGDGRLRTFLLAGWVCAEFTLVWGPLPLVSFELAWMVVLAVLGGARAGLLPGSTRSTLGKPAPAAPS